jgi:2OG-Fe dioxygenase
MVTTDPSDELHRVWEQLTERDFALSNDIGLGLDPETREHIARNFFNEKVLESDHPAVHRDRDRARDVIRYDWSGEYLSLREHDVVEIRNRSGFVGSRTPKRAILLDDVLMTEWIETALRLIPPHLRQVEGTFGVNFLRTRTTVVSGPHQDDEEFVLVYVADKIGDGAETTLRAVDDPEEIVHRVTLAPGDLIVFRDAVFLHNASPLISPPETRAHRDAVVCTVNYKDTYELL